MKGWIRLVGVLLLQLPSNAVQAVEMQIDQKEATRQVCSGMYSRKSWGGNNDPFILIKFLNPDSFNAVDPIVSLVVFEWHDMTLLGMPIPNSDADAVPTMQYVCDKYAVDDGLCDKSKLGGFILKPNATDVAQSQIISQAIHLRDPPVVNYPIKKTGYYCVGTTPFSNEDYNGVVEFRNAFGELPAAQIAKLPFYSGITIVYAFLAMGWGALYFFHRRDILPVQNYITAILVFLVVEMFMTWLFYDFQNRHGMNAGAKALLVVVSILSAARNSFSFFLLLIVCMGYGVVKPTLGKQMTYVRYLAITHFVFGVIYAVASLSVTPENAGPLILLVVLPLAATLTAFYIWTLNSLNATTKDLVARKQTIKAAMYRKLWYCILTSIVVIFVFFFVNSWIFAGQGDEDFVPSHWKGRWFILDGWLNLVYFFDVAFVAYVWRPSANNRRFAMSDEIAQDDDGFEISSLRDSMDIDDDAEAMNGYKRPDEEAGYNGRLNRDASPLPAPIPQKPMPLPRESLEGETIFAVGEEDRFSDESDGDDEGGALGNERSGIMGRKRD
ncbi:lung seven transmembrane receptor-domain-containing protein [Neohortaea acidophila]|uniref:Lung seven transmembrane receptor-domain-containing protein n=1 Tax=Neohortaea acidophila TaxID=245834 RepID=A0A6A6Q1L7_9PEZI|nr:lung seven transmembrane receptor-domain-containing protein [Neohortaea acidophila]KAF2486290.1 lung seven transmembrane receptor-domain-containing protein [Neohortaea acidophila]